MSPISKFNGALVTFDDRQPFADRMRELREANNVSQQDCAEALGVSQPVYSDMENNRQSFRRRDLVTLAALYKLPLTKAFPGAR
jgi:transcriptional regulator with XRE-family HTH domain